MKKIATPYFNINNSPSPPFFSGLSLFSSKKFGTPQVTQILEGPTLLFHKEKGGSNYD